MAFKARGPLDVRSLERAIEFLVRRHDILRSTSAESADGVVLIVHAESEGVLRHVDLSHILPGRRAHELSVRLNEDGRLPFTLSSGPLFECVLYRCGADEHALLVRTHHSVVDGWSVGVIADELVRSYEAYSAGGEPSLPVLPLRYADFAHWQRLWLKSEACQDQLGYWRKQLRGSVAELTLREARARPATRSHRGAIHWFFVPPHLVDALARTAEQQETRMLAILVGLYSLLLTHHSGQTEFVLGSLVANRSATELRNLVGAFVNIVPLRVDLTGDPTCAEVLAGAGQVVGAALANADLPFEWLVDELRPVTSPGATPYFQAAIVFQNQPIPEVSLPDLTIENCAVDVGTSKYDMSLTFFPKDGGLYGSLRYNTDLFDRATIVTYAEELCWIMAAATAEPERRSSELLEALTAAAKS